MVNLGNFGSVFGFRSLSSLTYASAARGGHQISLITFLHYIDVRISYQLRKLGKFALSYLDTFIH
jgi:hypothetical protein